MLQVARKTYTITVIVTEGSDEFWEALRNKSGCDEVVDEVRAALGDRGFVEPDCHVRLAKFEERDIPFVGSQGF